MSTETLPARCRRRGHVWAVHPEGGWGRRTCHRCSGLGVSVLPADFSEHIHPGDLVAHDAGSGWERIGLDATYDAMRRDPRMIELAANLRWRP